MSVTLCMRCRMDLLNTLSVDYDLVRIYHPDSPVARKYPAEIAQARFQSISTAYDLMRGKSAITGEVLTSRERHMDPARFRPKAPRRPHFDETTGDERWKERVLFGATVIVSLVHSTTCWKPTNGAHRPSSHSSRKPRLLAMKRSFGSRMVPERRPSIPWRMSMKGWPSQPNQHTLGDYDRLQWQVCPWHFI